MWIAQSLVEASVGDIPMTVFAQYGALGIFAALLTWFARGAYQRETNRSDRLEEENKRLNALIVDRVIPTLTSASTAAEEAGKLMNAMQREREVLREVFRQRDGREGTST